jgi:hypothetical protein
MDEPPPWHELSRRICYGETRRCGGGDAACRREAENDGYVSVSLYDFCRREEIHTVPRPASAALLVGLLAVISVVLWRVRRLRRVRSP